MNLKNRFINTFIFGIILGLATHMYRLTNWMLCEDSLNYLDTISPSWTISVGRYWLPKVEYIRGTYELSWLIGLMCIIFLALSSGIIAEMFKVDGTIRRLLLAWIVVCNPVVTSTFAYMYTADGYYFGFMLICLYAYLLDREDKKRFYIPATICFAVSMAFYQGFITAAIVLIFIRLILMLLDEKYKIKDVLYKGLGYLIPAGIGCGIYYIGLKIAWKITDHSLAAYMGLGEKPKQGLIRYWYELKECYIDFARVFLVRWKLTGYNVTNVIMFLIVAVIILTLITKRKLWKQPSRWLLVILLCGLLPVATHIFEFLSESVSYTTTIMDYGTMMVFLMPVVLIGQLDLGDGSFSELIKMNYIKKHIFWVFTAVIMLYISFNFTVIANKAYYNMFMANKNCETLVNRIETRMEMIDGYDSEMEVMMVGSCYQMPEYVTNAPMMSGVVSNIFITGENGYVNYMNKMLSTGYGKASLDKEKEIAQTDEYKEMGYWPSMSSVKIIDDVMVIKLSDNDEDLLYE